MINSSIGISSCGSVGKFTIRNAWAGQGTRLARIRNVERPLTEWKIDYFDLYRGKVFRCVWIVKENGYVYLFSPTDTGDSLHSPTFLTRFPEAALDAEPSQINSFNFSKLVRNLAIYVPRAVYVQRPLSLNT